MFDFTRAVTNVVRHCRRKAVSVQETRVLEVQGPFLLGNHWLFLLVLYRALVLLPDTRSDTQSRLITGDRYRLTIGR